VIIPAFAIGRVEEVLYWLKRLEDEKRIPVLPVYVDSPMAIEGLRLHVNRSDELDAGLQGSRRKLTAFATTHFESVTSPRQSADLVQSTRPAIIVSSSGMATGGRVLAHLAKTLARSAPHGAVRGLPGGGHEGPIADRRRQTGEDARAPDRRGGPDRENRRDVGARRSERNHPLARRLLQAAAPRVHRPWRADAQDALRAKIAATLGWEAHCPEYLERAEV
jgi:metallo-beta-lactamase family protein